jgi:PKD repeat protein
VVLAFAAATAEAQLEAALTHDPGLSNSPATFRDDVSIDVLSAEPRSFEPLRIHAPGASYLRLHFARFSLPEGIVLEVGNGDGTEIHRYASGNRDAMTVDRARGDDGVNRFSAMSVTGDTAVVRVLGRLDRFDPARHGVLIDAWLEGPNKYTSATAASKGPGGTDSHIESTCGANERYDVKCYAESHPAEYDRSIPVALLITSTGEECTAWRAGPDNRMFTAEHCISGQGDLDGSEIWFHYRAESCGSSAATEPVKVTGGQLLAQDGALDFALFTVNDFASIAYLGHLGLDVRNGVTGEGIFIPQHGLGQPRQIALESDMNTSGLCEIDDNDYDGYAAGSDLAYFCDTTTSSSGAPVIARATGKAIALHHLGGCFNSGSKVSLIWPKVAAHFGGVVPDGDNADGWNPGNQAPEAHFSLACDALSCSFDASASSDGDGSVANYAWAFGDGGTAAGVAADLEFADAGSYTVTLTVQDDEGATASGSKSVTVSLPNADPAALFSTQCQDNACEFDGAGSSDPDGQILSWNWKFGDGGTASGAQVAHQYVAAGSYSITLTVKDDAGASDSRSHTVTVSLPNANPEAVFSVSCDALDCSADAAGSADPDGQITSWHWELGDGQSAAGPGIAHSYAAAGTYTITLTVSDDDGASGTASHSVNVQVPDPDPDPEPVPVNQPPAAAFTSACAADRCTFDGRASGDGDGHITAFHWSFGDGHEASGAQAEHVYAADGQFQVTLTVEDDAGASDAASGYVDVTLPAPGPTAEFTVACEHLSCTLDAGSGTADAGDSASYDWDFGDGATGQGRTVTHEYAEDGVYRVTLKVSGGGTLSATRSRTVEVVSARPIELEGSGARLNERGVAALKWSEAATATVIVRRDGKQIAEVANTGKYLDTDTKGIRKTARYQVCDSLGEHCSTEIVVLFAPAWSSQYPEGKTPPGKVKR